MSRPAHTLAFALVSAALACAALAGCGGGGSPTVQIRGLQGVPAGFTRYQGPAYTFVVPQGLEQLGSQGSTGRIVAGWMTRGSGDFLVDATYDPHPATLSTVVSTDLAGSRKAFNPPDVSVSKAIVPGATAARLITDSGPHGAGPYHNLPQHNEELIVTTRNGALIDLLVVSHGTANPNPSAVINSLHLTQ